MTIVKNYNGGAVLYTTPDDLVQVKEGADFYIGQVRWVVRRIIPTNGDLLIYVLAP